MNTNESGSVIINCLREVVRRQENDERVDLLAICDGDSSIASRVRELLDLERELGTTPLETDPVAANPLADITKDDDVTYGKYRIISPLGQGGMGEVVLAEQRSLKRLVALKLMLPSAYTEDTMRLRFRREAEITASLNHPAIIPIFAVGETDGRLFIAMKWLPGPTLTGDERDWSPREVAAVGAELARGLHEAHLAGIVHRDVKPANVLLDGDQPVLIDFGLARSQGDLTLTKPGAIAGTLTYLAPEQLHAGHSVFDPRSDIYGLGATLYELLAKAPPFRSVESGALVREILEDRPPSLDLHGQDRDLETILLRCLAKNPSDRFSSAEALAQDLDAWRDGRPIASSRPGPWIHATRFIQRHPRSTFVVTIALALVLLLTSKLAMDTIQTRDRLSDRVNEASAQIQRTDFKRAEVTVRNLEKEFSNDAQVGRLRDQLNRERALEELLDTVLERPTTQSLSLLLSQLATLDASNAEPTRPVLEQSARALAYLALRRPADALDAASKTNALTSEAIHAVLDQDHTWRPKEDDLAKATAPTLVVAAMVLRLLGANPRETTPIALAAIAAAGDPDSPDPAMGFRARYTLAVVDSETTGSSEDEGKALTEALRRFQILADADERRPALLRNIARISFLLGEFERGAAAQADLKNRFPNAWSAGDIYWRLVGLRESGKLVEFETELSVPENRRHSLVLLLDFQQSQLQARAVVHDDRQSWLDRADRSLTAAREVAATPFERDLVDAYFFHEALEAFAVSEPNRSDFDRLIQQGQAILERALDRRSRRIVAHGLGKLFISVGAPKNAIGILESVADTDPLDREIALLLADAVVAALRKDARPTVDPLTKLQYYAFPVPPDWVTRVRRAIEALRDASGNSQTRVRQLSSAAMLAISLGQRTQAHHLAKNGWSLTQRSETPIDAQDLAFLKLYVDALEGE